MPVSRRLGFTLDPASKGLTVCPRIDHRAPQDIHQPPLAGLPELHVLHARSAQRANAIAEQVSRLVNSGLSYPDASAVARRPTTRSHRFGRQLYRP